MPLIKIHSINDPHIEPYINIRERDLVGRQHHFIAEGRVVIQVLIGTSHIIESFLFSEKHEEFAHEISPFIDPKIPVYLAEQSVLDNIAGFPLHRGLLALAQKKPSVSASELLSGLPDQSVILAAIGIANHDNMGGIFRNAAAFGCSAVLLDTTSCDPYYRKAIRVSVGGVLKVPFSSGDQAENIIDELKARKFDIYALSPSGQRELRDIPRGRPTAFLLGTEGNGLPDHILQSVATVKIPICSDFDSLNVAACSAIALYEMNR